MSSDLEARITRLEKSNQSLKVLVGFLLVAVLFAFRGMFLSGVPEVMTTQSLVIRSSEGIATASIDSAGVSFYTKAGQVSTRIEAHGDNAGVFVHGKKLGSALTTTTSTNSR